MRFAVLGRPGVLDPLAGDRDATDGRTLKSEFSASALELDDENLATADQSAAAVAPAPIIEGMPEMRLIEIAESVQPVFGQELKRRHHAHAEQNDQPRDVAPS